MTLDDDAYISQREAMRRQEDEDRARVEAEWRLREELESIEARETYWVGVFAQMPQHIRDIRYGGDVTS